MEKSSLLIRNVLLDGKVQDLFIEENRIARIGESLAVAAAREIDGSGKAAIPGLVNGHTHAAMTLLRGIGDDMPLMPWLHEKIWPNEAKLTEEDIYWGSRLACLEMIKSGTTLFNDMYYRFDVTAEAVREMGIRAVLGSTCFDHHQPELALKCREETVKTFDNMKDYGSRVRFAISPHAIYTVSGELLQWADRFAGERGLLIHIHMAETAGEVADAVNQFGETPVRYLKRLGVLSPRMVMAHAIYVDEEEIRIMAGSGVKVVHNPASNMKLASGAEFKFDEMRRAGIEVGIGTDGCSSSNNLDMVEAVKLASLLGKSWRGDPEAAKAEDVFTAATREGASILGWQTGILQPGYLADICLVDLRQPALTPNHNFISNLVYAANGSCIDTVVCDGRIVMENRRVPGEDEILEKAAERAYNLIHRS